MGEWIAYGAIISITHRQREFAVKGITFSSANPVWPDRQHLCPITQVPLKITNSATLTHHGNNRQNGA